MQARSAPLDWRIENPAPAGAAGERWGDTHFARGLRRGLESAGVQARIDFHPSWGASEAGDVVLVLRGRHRWQPAQGSGFRLLWIISHPDLVTPDECADYHLVVAGSQRHADWLRERTRVPVVWLGQCTDADRFHPPLGDQSAARSEFIFVGNRRGVRREIVYWALEAGLPLKIWGKGWSGRVPATHIAGDYLSNEDLPDLYRRAKVTLDDHWPDMRRWGYVNNRIFDALACGLPVISEHHRELQRLFPELVMTCATREQFLGCVETLMFEYPLRVAGAAAAAAVVCREHSFEVRARELVRLVREHRRG